MRTLKTINADNPEIIFGHRYPHTPHTALYVDRKHWIMNDAHFAMRWELVAANYPFLLLQGEIQNQTPARIRLYKKGLARRI